MKNSIKQPSKPQEESKSLEEKQDNKNSSEKVDMVSTERYQNTALRVVSIDGEQTWFITSGTYRLTDKTYKTKEGAMAAIKRKDWDIIVGMICGIIQHMEDSRELTGKFKKPKGPI